MRGDIPKGGGQATRSCPYRSARGNGYAPRSIAFKLGRVTREGVTR